MSYSKIILNFKHPLLSKGFHNFFPKIKRDVYIHRPRNVGNLIEIAKVM